ncbi:MAG TPA: NAD(+) synthase [Aggregatilinea sp.]|jgi:NAD+ synthase|uniref:NAD(+) synthase n=1 Tax=Aggregatilinea sp. TaxID=2806333 RepID=UPI002B80C045|nr:NAD(+) synthase [Aggregatilinea sp.]HML20714.1 NAD(+) synthase [Aggregatilinea sp.]
MTFSEDVLKIDPAAETERIISFMREQVGRVMHRRGAVVGVSGGIDSSVCLALSARAFGPQRVAAIMMPEKDSEAESEALARLLSDAFDVKPTLEVITPALEGFRCYQRRDEAIARVFPEYDAAKGYKAKIVLPNNLLDDNTLNVFKLTIITPEGEEKTQRLPLNEYLQIVAASNFKQRTRMTTLYYHAEERNYAVIGTGNKNEHEQGFFVKYGDGGADIKPIIHLYKTQVYQLAEYLGVPEEIRRRQPTTDTYSAHQSQEEFFFRLPFKTMDLLWYAQENNVPIAEVAEGMGLTEVQVQRAFDDFKRKQRTTDYLRMNPIGLDDVVVEGEPS